MTEAKVAPKAGRLTKETRETVKKLAWDALLDSRDPETRELDRMAARQTTLARLHHDYPAYYFEYMTAALQAAMEQDVQSIITQSRKRLRQRVEDGNVSLDKDVSEHLYSEMVSWRVEGRATAVTKFLGDCTTAELQLVVKNIAARIDRDKQVMKHYKDIITRMKSKGAGLLKRVADVFA